MTIRELKEKLIEASKKGNNEEYHKLSMLYCSIRNSKKQILERINFYRSQNNVDKIKKWEEILKLKDTKLREKAKPLSFEDILKYPDIKVFFWRNDKFFYILSNGVLRKFQLKLGGGDNVREIINDPDKLKKTKQYRYMSLLGFKTKNGRTYTYDDGKINIWISFSKSKIKKLKVNNWLVEHFTFIPNKQFVKILLRKGLTFDDIRLYNNIETMTDKENKVLMDKIRK
ncbi:hypothetical protein HYX00_04050 [Candidatus Woesearchaeota archaeon]|nr:hypothetical protein [Candidatus Woesearchaeota archaeon]